MQTRFISASSFLLATGLWLPLAATVSAQDPEAQDERAQRLSGYVDKMVDSPELMRNEVVALLNQECAKVAMANASLLDRVESWLFENVRVRHQSILATRRQEFRSREGRSPDAVKQARIEQLEVELLFADLMYEEVGKCIERRRRELRGKFLPARKPPAVGKPPEGEPIHATWKTSCTSTPGVQADSVGILKLTFSKDEVTGSARWLGSEITLDVTGRYLEDGSLEMALVRPEALEEFHLTGKVTAGPAGVRGGGAIRYGNTFKGCNIGPDPNVCVHKITCSGRWTIPW